MRSSRRLALGAALLALVGACSPGEGSTPTIKIGSVGFDEARVMAEIYAQVLEHNGYVVDRSGIGLGARAVVAPAIESGQIDLQPEYIGSRLSYEITQSLSTDPGPTGDAAANHAALQVHLTKKNLTVLGYTPAVDTNAFVVRADTAAALNLTTMSDTAAVQGQLKWGLAADCLTNALCGKPGGALDQYGITQATIASATLLAACETPMADALKNGTIDVAELCSTQPDILVNGWVVLEDDKKTQPADNIAPVVRNDYLAKVDRTEFAQVLNDVSGRIETATLAELYKKVSVDRRDPRDVAREWLLSVGVLPQPQPLNAADYLALADWRRQIAELYALWRAVAADDPARATRDFRAARDRLFRHHPQSPLPPDERPAYHGVRYFDYDPAYRMMARVEFVAEQPGGSAQLLYLPASGEEPFSLRRVGRVTLGGPLAGEQLWLFWFEGYAGGVFLPFRDATSGLETYGAGRYLLDTIKGADLGATASGELVLDFNMAYHPSCAYDPRWNCPLAPRENRIGDPIRAGERLGTEALL